MPLIFPVVLVLQVHLLHYKVIFGVRYKRSYYAHRRNLANCVQPLLWPDNTAIFSVLRQIFKIVQCLQSIAGYAQTMFEYKLENFKIKLGTESETCAVPFQRVKQKVRKTPQ